MDYQCVCEEPGYFNSGIPGILAHIENGEIIGEVEACEGCERYLSDKSAERALHKHLQFDPETAPSTE